ncbi:MAG: glycosyltransferase family 1 protein [Candidatus Firestonebacteria bacterium]
MKIAVDAKVLTYKDLGGIGNYTYNILKTISQIDKENEYVLCANAPILHKINAANFKERYLSFPKDKYFAYIGLPFLFIKEKYDLLFLPTMAMPVFLRPKTLMVCHDLFIDKTSWRKKLFMLFSINYALRRADKIIADSVSTRNDIVKLCKIHEENVSVIPLSYDQSLYNLCKDSSLIAKIKNKYKIKGKYLMNVNSILCYRKNIINQIKAFDIVRKVKKNDIQLIITGKKDNAYDDIMSIVKQLDLQEDVILIEHIINEDMSVLYSGAEALMFASSYEGFGLPILEAMACGCPVLTSKISSMPEVAGESAVYVNHLDENDIANMVEKILKDSNLKSSLVSKGLERVKKFNWERTARVTLEVIMEMVNR